LKYSNSFSRCSAPIFAFVLLAALSLGVAAVPARLAAQESTPAAQSSTDSDNKVVSPGTIPGKAELSEQEEHNIYRHTELVHTLARVFHLDVETTARLFEFLNFAIIALAIVIPLARIMPKVIRKRSETLRHDLESARKLTEDANMRLSAVEAKMARFDQEIAEIRAHVEEDSKNDEARIKSTIGEESSRIVAAAEQEIASATAQAKRGLRRFVADLAIERAAKQLVLTPETDRALIAEFVSNSAKGGQN
jgi:F-type H+-transporting ATPase subunit b